MAESSQLQNYIVRAAVDAALATEALPLAEWRAVYRVNDGTMPAQARGSAHPLTVAHEVEELAAAAVTRHLADVSGDVVSVGAVDQCGPTTFVSTRTAQLLHVWRDKSQARLFHGALRRTAQAKFEHMVPAPVHVPLAVLVAHQGAYVSVVWLPPLMGADPVLVVPGSPAASALSLLQRALFLPEPLSLFAGRDGRFYTLHCLPVMRLQIDGVPVRGELLVGDACSPHPAVVGVASPALASVASSKAAAAAAALVSSFRPPPTHRPAAARDGDRPAAAFARRQIADALHQAGLNLRMAGEVHQALRRGPHDAQDEPWVRQAREALEIEMAARTLKGLFRDVLLGQHDDKDRVVAAMSIVRAATEDAAYVRDVLAPALARKFEVELLVDPRVLAPAWPVIVEHAATRCGLAVAKGGTRIAGVATAAVAVSVSSVPAHVLRASKDGGSTLVADTMAVADGLRTDYVTPLRFKCVLYSLLMRTAADQHRAFEAAHDAADGEDLLLVARGMPGGRLEAVVRATLAPLDGQDAGKDRLATLFAAHRCITAADALLITSTAPPYGLIGQCMRLSLELLRACSPNGGGTGPTDARYWDFAFAMADALETCEEPLGLTRVVAGQLAEGAVSFLMDSMRAAGHDDWERRAVIALTAGGVMMPTAPAFTSMDITQYALEADDRWQRLMCYVPGLIASGAVGQKYNRRLLLQATSTLAVRNDVRYVSHADKPEAAATKKKKAVEATAAMAGNELELTDPKMWYRALFLVRGLFENGHSALGFPFLVIIRRYLVAQQFPQQVLEDTVHQCELLLESLRRAAWRLHAQHHDYQWLLERAVLVLDGRLSAVNGDPFEYETIAHQRRWRLRCLTQLRHRQRIELATRISGRCAAAEPSEDLRVLLASKEADQEAAHGKEAAELEESFARATLYSSEQLMPRVWYFQHLRFHRRDQRLYEQQYIAELKELAARSSGTRLEDGAMSAPPPDSRVGPCTPPSLALYRELMRFDQARRAAARSARLEVKAQLADHPTDWRRPDSIPERAWKQIVIHRSALQRELRDGDAANRRADWDMLNYMSAERAVLRSAVPQSPQHTQRDGELAVELVALTDERARQDRLERRELRDAMLLDRDKVAARRALTAHDEGRRVEDYDRIRALKAEIQRTLAKATDESPHHERLRELERQLLELFRIRRENEHEQRVELRTEQDECRPGGPQQEWLRHKVVSETLVSFDDTCNGAFLAELDEQRDEIAALAAVPPPTRTIPQQSRLVALLAMEHATIRALWVYRDCIREDTVQLAASFATVAFSQKEKVLRDLLAADDRQRNEDSAAALRFVQEEASMLEHDPRVDKAMLDALTEKIVMFRDHRWSADDAVEASYQQQGADIRRAISDDALLDRDAEDAKHLSADLERTVQDLRVLRRAENDNDLERLRAELPPLEVAATEAAAARVQALNAQFPVLLDRRHVLTLRRRAALLDGVPAGGAARDTVLRSVATYDEQRWDLDAALLLALRDELDNVLGATTPAAAVRAPALVAECAQVLWAQRCEADDAIRQELADEVVATAPDGGRAHSTRYAAATAATRSFDGTRRGADTAYLQRLRHEHLQLLSVDVARRDGLRQTAVTEELAAVRDRRRALDDVARGEMCSELERFGQPAAAPERVLELWSTLTAHDEARRSEAAAWRQDLKNEQQALLNGGDTNLDPARLAEVTALLAAEDRRLWDRDEAHRAALREALVEHTRAAASADGVEARGRDAVVSHLRGALSRLDSVRDGEAVAEEAQLAGELPRLLQSGTEEGLQRAEQVHELLLANALERRRQAAVQRAERIAAVPEQPGPGRDAALRDLYAFDEERRRRDEATAARLRAEQDVMYSGKAPPHAAPRLPRLQAELGDVTRSRRDLNVAEQQRLLDETLLLRFDSAVGDRRLYDAWQKSLFDFDDARHSEAHAQLLRLFSEAALYLDVPVPDDAHAARCAATVVEWRDLESFDRLTTAATRYSLAEEIDAVGPAAVPSLLWALRRRVLQHDARQRREDTAEYTVFSTELQTWVTSSTHVGVAHRDRVEFLKSRRNELRDLMNDRARVHRAELCTEISETAPDGPYPHSDRHGELRVALTAHDDVARAGLLDVHAVLVQDIAALLPLSPASEVAQTRLLEARAELLAADARRRELDAATRAELRAGVLHSSPVGGAADRKRCGEFKKRLTKHDAARRAEDKHLHAELVAELDRLVAGGDDVSDDAEARLFEVRQSLRDLARQRRGLDHQQRVELREEQMWTRPSGPLPDSARYDSATDTITAYDDARRLEDQVEHEELLAEVQRLVAGPTTRRALLRLSEARRDLADLDDARRQQDSLLRAELVEDIRLAAPRGTEADPARFAKLRQALQVHDEARRIEDQRLHREATTELQQLLDAAETPHSLERLREVRQQLRQLHRARRDQDHLERRELREDLLDVVPGGPVASPVLHKQAKAALADHDAARRQEDRAMQLELNTDITALLQRKDSQRALERLCEVRDELGDLHRARWQQDALERQELREEMLLCSPVGAVPDQGRFAVATVALQTHDTERRAERATVRAELLQELDTLLDYEAAAPTQLQRRGSMSLSLSASPIGERSAEVELLVKALDATCRSQDELERDELQEDIGSLHSLPAAVGVLRDRLSSHDQRCRAAHFAATADLLCELRRRLLHRSSMEGTFVGQLKDTYVEWAAYRREQDKVQRGELALAIAGSASSGQAPDFEVHQAAVAALETFDDDRRAEDITCRADLSKEMAAIWRSPDPRHVLRVDELRVLLRRLDDQRRALDVQARDEVAAQLEHPVAGSRRAALVDRLCHINDARRQAEIEQLSETRAECLQHRYKLAPRDEPVRFQRLLKELRAVQQRRFANDDEARDGILCEIHTVRPDGRAPREERYAALCRYKHRFDTDRRAEHVAIEAALRSELNEHLLSVDVARRDGLRQTAVTEELAAVRDRRRALDDVARGEMCSELERFGQPAAAPERVLELWSTLTAHDEARRSEAAAWRQDLKNEQQALLNGGDTNLDPARLAEVTALLAAEDRRLWDRDEAHRAALREALVEHTRAAASADGVEARGRDAVVSHLRGALSRLDSVRDGEAVAEEAQLAGELPRLLQSGTEEGLQRAEQVHELLLANALERRRQAAVQRAERIAAVPDQPGPGRDAALRDLYAFDEERRRRDEATAARLRAEQDVMYSGKAPPHAAPRLPRLHAELGDVTRSRREADLEEWSRRVEHRTALEVAIVDGDDHDGAVHAAALALLNADLDAFDKQRREEDFAGLGRLDATALALVGYVSAPRVAAANDEFDQLDADRRTFDGERRCQLRADVFRYLTRPPTASRRVHATTSTAARALLDQHDHDRRSEDRTQLRELAAEIRALLDPTRKQNHVRLVVVKQRYARLEALRGEQDDAIRRELREQLGHAREQHEKEALRAAVFAHDAARSAEDKDRQQELRAELTHLRQLAAAGSCTPAQEAQVIDARQALAAIDNQRRARDRRRRDELRHEIDSMGNRFAGTVPYAERYAAVLDDLRRHDTELQAEDETLRAELTAELHGCPKDDKRRVELQRLVDKLDDDRSAQDAYVRAELRRFQFFFAADIPRLSRPNHVTTRNAFHAHNDYRRRIDNAAIAELREEIRDLEADHHRSQIGDDRLPEARAALAKRIIACLELEALERAELVGEIDALGRGLSNDDPDRVLVLRNRVQALDDAREAFDEQRRSDLLSSIRAGGKGENIADLEAELSNIDRRRRRLQSAQRTELRADLAAAKADVANAHGPTVPVAQERLEAVRGALEHHDVHRRRLDERRVAELEVEEAELLLHGGSVQAAERTRLVVAELDEIRQDRRRLDETLRAELAEALSRCTVGTAAFAAAKERLRAFDEARTTEDVSRRDFIAQRLVELRNSPNALARKLAHALEEERTVLDAARRVRAKWQRAEMLTELTAAGDSFTDLESVRAPLAAHDEHYQSESLARRGLLRSELETLWKLRENGVLSDADSRRLGAVEDELSVLETDRCAVAVEVRAGLRSQVTSFAGRAATSEQRANLRQRVIAHDDALTRFEEERRGEIAAELALRCTNAERRTALQEELLAIDRAQRDRARRQREELLEDIAAVPAGTERDSLVADLAHHDKTRRAADHAEEVRLHGTIVGLRDDAEDPRHLEALEEQRASLLLQRRAQDETERAELWSAASSEPGGRAQQLPLVAAFDDARREETALLRAAVDGQLQRTLGQTSRINVKLVAQLEAEIAALDARQRADDERQREEWAAVVPGLPSDARMAMRDELAIFDEARRCEHFSRMKEFDDEVDSLLEITDPPPAIKARIKKLRADRAELERYRRQLDMRIRSEMRTALAAEDTSPEERNRLRAAIMAHDEARRLEDERRLKALEAELKREMDRDPRDPDRIEELQAMIAALDAERRRLDRQQREELMGELRRLKALGLMDEVARLRALIAAQDAARREADRRRRRQLLEELMTVIAEDSMTQSRRYRELKLMLRQLASRQRRQHRVERQGLLEEIGEGEVEGNAIAVDIARRELRDRECERERDQRTILEELRAQIGLLSTLHAPVSKYRLQATIKELNKTVEKMWREFKTKDYGNDYRMVELRGDLEAWAAQRALMDEEEEEEEVVAEPEAGGDASTESALMSRGSGSSAVRALRVPKTSTTGRRFNPLPHSVAARLPAMYREPAPTTPVLAPPPAPLPRGPVHPHVIALREMSERMTEYPRKIHIERHRFAVSTVPVQFNEVESDMSSDTD